MVENTQMKELYKTLKSHEQNFVNTGEMMSKIESGLNELHQTLASVNQNIEYLLRKTNEAGMGSIAERGDNKLQEKQKRKETVNYSVGFLDFDGSNPQEWLCQANKFFENYPDDEFAKVRHASFYLTGDADLWFIENFEGKERVTWHHFSSQLLGRFLMIEPIPSGNLSPGFDPSTCRNVFVGSVLEVTNCFPFPGREDDDETETDNANYQLEMMRCLREVDGEFESEEPDGSLIDWYVGPEVVEPEVTGQVVENNMTLNADGYSGCEPVVMIDDYGYSTFHIEAYGIAEVEEIGSTVKCTESCKETLSDNISSLAPEDSRTVDVDVHNGLDLNQQPEDFDNCLEDDVGKNVSQNGDQAKAIPCEENSMDDPNSLTMHVPLVEVVSGKLESLAGVEIKMNDDQEAVDVQTLLIVTSVLDGYNVCNFAYGQTGTGKTYTMEGTLGYKGVNYRTLEELFRLSKESSIMKYELSVSRLEDCNEKIRDLLLKNSNQPAKKLEIKQYGFEGRCDLVRFVKTIQKAGPYAHLRIGPYVYAEWNFGGFPVWLKYVTDISFRTDNEPFKLAMKGFADKIANLMKSEKLYESQIENEYGTQAKALGAAGHPYSNWAANKAVVTGNFFHFLSSSTCHDNHLLNYSPSFSLRKSFIKCVLTAAAWDTVELNTEETRKETENQGDDKENENVRLYVGKFSFSMTSIQLSEILAEAGRVLCWIIMLESYNRYCKAVIFFFAPHVVLGSWRRKICHKRKPNRGNQLVQGFLTNRKA